MKYLISYDPGAMTGIAIQYRENNRVFLSFCRQFLKSKVFPITDELIATYNPSYAVVEKPMLGVMYFSEKRAKLGTAGQIKLMQNVGQNIEWTNRLSEYLRGKGIKVIE
jgi:hypothetical protein